jgi:hypothetical protein
LCYFLYIASPLTLSEVRSMLPSGLTADLTSGPLRAALQELHPPARTAARLLVGACSCDLVRPRQADPLEDERELRARYRQAGLSRAEVIGELERHRRGASRSRITTDWAELLAGFVVEHARNAGPTLYLLDFSAGGFATVAEGSRALATYPAKNVAARAGPWLAEGRPILVS